MLGVAAIGGGFGAAAGAVGLGARGAAPPLRTASMSAFTIRPCGPVPLRRVASTPACAAMRRASGLANTRSCPLLAGATAAGVVLGSAGIGGSAVAGFGAVGAFAGGPACGAGE